MTHFNLTYIETSTLGSVGCLGPTHIEEIRFSWDTLVETNVVPAEVTLREREREREREMLTTALTHQVLVQNKEGSF